MATSSIKSRRKPPWIPLFICTIRQRIFLFHLQGKPNCLSGLTFVLTGVYDSLERDEAADLIKEYGGKVTTSLSKKTSYIVLGEEAGLAKVAKADELGTKRLSEDGLLDLIRVKSGLPTKESQAEGTPSKEKNSSTSGEKTNGEKSKAKVTESPRKMKEEKKTPKKEGSTPVTSKPTVIKDRTPKKESSEPTKVKSERRTPKKEATSSATSTSSANKSLKFEKSEDIPIDRKLSEHQQNIASVDNQAWVDKYKPTNIKQIIGQQGAASNVVK